MAKSRKKLVLKILGALVLAVVAIAGWFAWTTLRVDDAPDELEAMERRPDDLVVPSLGDGPDLRVADMRGATSFIVVEGIQSMRTEQGKELNRALNRWELPETTKGYIVFDGEGMQMFEEKVSRFLGFFADEVRFPVYVDFDAEALDVFKLAKGHHGFVVLDPQGEVLLRHSGGIQGAKLDKVRELIGAKEPPEPKPAPKFALAGVDNEACRQKSCMFLFLGKKVSRSEIPWIEDGFEGTRTECFERMHRPEIRLAASAMRVKIERSHGVVVGQTDDLRLEGWKLVDEDAAAREAFGLAPDENALVVIDKQGRLAFRETGFIPMYRWTLAIDVTGESIKRDDES